MDRNAIPDQRSREILESWYQVIARKGLEGATLLPGLEKLKSANERLSYYIEKTLNFDVAQTVDDKVFYGCFNLALKEERIRNSYQCSNSNEKILSNH